MDPYSPQGWQAIERHFAAALHLADSERVAYLDRSCATDPELRVAVERLLRAHSEAPEFLSALSAPGVAALFHVAGDERVVPTTVGPYAVERELGRGGMGVVYLARDSRLDRPVALKLLAPYLGGSPTARRRFADEARAASAIDHPHIATIYDVGETADGTLYIAMAFCDGITLRDRLRHARLEVPEARRLALELADALAAAHQRRIVHRDVKPGNIMFSATGAAKLLDFGIAKLTGDDAAARTRAHGTTAYMSPEQTRGDAPLPAQDIWSFGVTMYEALTGTRPFRGSDTRALTDALRHAVPEPIGRLRADLPRAFVAVIERCLAKDPRERYPDGSALLDALRAIPAAGSVPPTRARWYVAALSVIALVLGAATITLTRQAAGPAAPIGNAIAVLPFSTTGDSALRRLGSDMAVMLSANLDGVGELRTIDPQTILAQVRAHGSSASAGERAALARRLGAAHLLHGILVRVGPSVRADAMLTDVASGRTLGRASVIAEGTDVVALTDSLTWILLRQLHGAVPPGSTNASVLMTRSVDALRAFLEGERLVGEGRMRQAPEAFARAFAADSTFWLAYWRHAHTSAYWGLPVDARIHRAYRDNRAELPARDRMLVESRMADSIGERLDRGRAVTQAFPDFWLGWWELAERLVHETPFLGTTRAEAAAALEQVILLNPGHALAWQHRMWLALSDRDTVTSGRALARLAAMNFDSVANAENGVPSLPLYRFLHAAAVRDGTPDPALAREAVRNLSGFTGRVPHDDFGAGASEYGLHAAQVELSRQLVAMEGVPAGIVAAARRGIAVGHAGRGAWSDAMHALHEYVRHADGDGPVLHAYRLASYGEWLGSLPAGSGETWGTTLARRSDRLPSITRAELLWWRGVLAARHGDREPLAAARRALSEVDFRFAPLLERSLRAFEHAMTGDTAAAAAVIVALERERAQLRQFVTPGNGHPYLSAVNRLAGSRWLLSAGDTAGAAELLTWHEAVVYYAPNVGHADAVAAGRAYQEWAMIEELRGRTERAAALHRLFVHRVDQRPPDRPTVVEDAARRTSVPR